MSVDTLATEAADILSIAADRPWPKDAQVAPFYDEAGRFVGNTVAREWGSAEDPPRCHRCARCVAHGTLCVLNLPVRVEPEDAWDYRWDGETRVESPAVLIGRISS